RTARRLRELPGIGEGHATTIGPWRPLRKNAARRRTALVVADEEMDLAAIRMIANIVGRHHRDAIRLAKRNAGAIDTGTIASAHHAIHPGMNVSALFGQHAPALLLIEKQDRATGKAVTCGRLHRRCGVAASDLGCTS